MIFRFINRNPQKKPPTHHKKETIYEFAPFAKSQSWWHRAETGRAAKEKLPRTERRNKMSN